MGVRTFTISHKRNDCIGCGSCVLLAGHTWRMSKDDGKACLRGAQWKGKEFMVAQCDEEMRADNEAAAAACPVKIIRIAQQRDA